ncbi:MAG: hypothetical protein FJ293_04555 [Planctomycetes bacterium]|nr:hypothetical protein [Planctomycetota bacterium]
MVRIPAPATLEFAAIHAELDAAALDARLERAAARLRPALALLGRVPAPPTLRAPVEIAGPAFGRPGAGVRPLWRLLPRLAAAAAVVGGIAAAWWSSTQPPPRTGRFAAETAALADRAIVPVRVVMVAAATASDREREPKPARGGP